MKNPETPPSARVIFGQNVRRVRRLKEMSQEELAFRADISRTYLSEVERGERNISVDNMEALAFALEMELPDLMRLRLLSSRCDTPQQAYFFWLQIGDVRCRRRPTRCAWGRKSSACGRRCGICESSS